MNNKPATGQPNSVIPARDAARPRAVDAGLQEAVDPAYWPRAIMLRLVIAVCYCLFVPAGLLPMAPAWGFVSAGTLLVYSAAMAVIYLRFGLLRWYRDLAPYADTLVVTLAVVALAKPEYPIWLGYFLIIPGLSNFYGSRYMLAFSFWTMVNFWAALVILAAMDRAGVNWGWGVIASFMAIFTALNADIISQSNQRLRALVYEASLTDPLTGLANRRRFRQVLDEHREPEPQPLAVLMYDLDNFKQINESCGHVYADSILIKVARELEECFRDADTVARYGGDELIVLAHVTAIEDAFALAQRSVARVIDTVGVTISAGVAVYPLGADSLEEAVQEADAALGRAKRGGKARAVLATAA